jgi:hypothetical protein
MPARRSRPTDVPSMLWLLVFARAAFNQFDPNIDTDRQQ